MRSHSEESLELAANHNFIHLTGFGLCLKGLAIANQGDPREGIAVIQSGIELLDLTGTLLNKGTTIEALASAYALAGDLEMALSTAEEGLAGAEETGELKYRMITPILKGSFLFAAGDPEAAEKQLLRGLELTRNAEVKLFELEAAAGLASIWMQQDKCEDARELLGSTYDWFTEGFDEVPLRAARELLEELS